MKKSISLLVMAIILSSCVPIRVVSKWSPDVYNGYKVIQGFQKKDTIGHTDVEQRKQDLIDCGVINFFGGTLDLNNVYPNMTDKQLDERRERIYDCMEAKGYIFTSSINCTNNGVPTGLCN